ncbi:unnamed protein product [Dicrocoelium dendriticum]|nr:unnamed protein product [Dicrocoelium dendriticum]
MLGSTSFIRSCRTFTWFTALSRKFSTECHTTLPNPESSSLIQVAKHVSAPTILGHHIVTEECLTSLAGDKPFYQLPVLHVLAKKNNMFVTLTDCNGRILIRSSCGAEGFRNARKRTTVAAQTLGISIGLKSVKLGVTSVRVRLHGIGPNRLSALSGAAMSGLQFVSLTDDTNVHYGHGRRPPKPKSK